jgi:hypothetical protein
MLLAVEGNTKLQFISIVEERCKLGGDCGDGLKVFIKFLFP